MIIVIVCGGRTFGRPRRGLSGDAFVAEMKRCQRQRSLLNATLDVLHEVTGIERVIHGDAYGADQLAGEWARQNNVEETPFPADWDKEPKRGGVIRNQQMGEFALTLTGDKRLVAFPGGRGTAHMIGVAKKLGIDVMQVEDIGA